MIRVKNFGPQCYSKNLLYCTFFQNRFFWSICERNFWALNPRVKPSYGHMIKNESVQNILKNPNFQKSGRNFDACRNFYTPKCGTIGKIGHISLDHQHFPNVYSDHSYWIPRQTGFKRGVLGLSYAPLTKCIALLVTKIFNNETAGIFEISKFRAFTQAFLARNVEFFFVSKNFKNDNEESRYGARWRCVGKPRTPAFECKLLEVTGAVPG